MMRPHRLRTPLLATALVAAALGAGWYARAAMNVPVGLSYSGLLKNNGVVEAGARTHDLVFELYDGNATVCTDGRANLPVVDGRFAVTNLFSGNGCTLDTLLATKPALFIRLTVDGQVLQPPEPLATVPFAARARVAESLDAPVLPSGAVMFFNLPACPAGWTELAGARGRYLVGLPGGGTLAGTGGMPLGDLEDRPAGKHGHAVTDPGHSHSYVNNGIWQYYCGGNYCQTQYGASQTTGSATTGITVDDYGAVPGTNAPYLQLLVCQKT